MTTGPDEIRWPRCATEEDLARLASPERVAELVSPLIAEAVRICGEVPRVPALAAIIAEAIARSPGLQEFDLAEIDPEEALEITRLVRLTVGEEMERFGR